MQSRCSSVTAGILFGPAGATDSTNIRWSADWSRWLEKAATNWRPGPSTVFSSRRGWSDEALLDCDGGDEYRIFGLLTRSPRVRGDRFHGGRGRAEDARGDRAPRCRPEAAGRTRPRTAQQLFVCGGVCLTAGTS